MMIKVIKIKVVYGWHGEPDGFAPVDKYSFQVLSMFGRHRVKFTRENLEDLQAVGFELQAQHPVLGI
jgi:hypothetical protein